MEKNCVQNLLDPQAAPNTQQTRYGQQKLKQLEVDEGEKARIDKEGILVLRMHMSSLFKKDGACKASLESPIDYLKVFEVHVSTGNPLPKHVTKDLKPVTVTVEKVSRLPTTPLSHKELSER